MLTSSTKAIIAALLICASTYVNAAPQTGPDKQVNEVMHSVMHKYAIPGAAVIIYKNGEMHQYTFGVMSNKSKVPVSNKTLFELGSITKSFSGLLLAEQVNNNELSLNDKLVKYLNNSESASSSIKQISLLQLATHSSGLPDSIPNLSYNAATTPKNKRTLTQFLRSEVATYSAGTHTLYSNLGFSLLGQALAHHKDISLDQLMQQDIFTPLTMHNTYLSVPKTANKFYADGYTAIGTPARSPQGGFLAGSWAIKSSATDMEAYLGAALSLPNTPDQIVKAMKAAQTGYFNVANRKWQLGLGWLITPLNNADINELLKIIPVAPHKKTPLEITEIATPKYEAHALIEKTGATNGFRAYIGVIPDQQIGVVILTNRFIFDSHVIEHTGRELLLK